MVSVPKELVSIRPVGVVVSDFKECSRRYDYNSESMIYMREDLTDALIGLESFSHMHVIYHQDRRTDWFKLMEWEQDEPPLTIPFASEPACQGVYSTRSPFRPSAMGSCVVEIIKREGNRIYVKGLDALDGTPILDIKIYIPRYDAFPFAQVPLNWGMDNEFIATSRHLRWDSINIGLTVGLRTGTKALQAIGLGRGEAVRAEVVGGHFFAQGVEGATGCSVLHNNMIFKESNTSPGEWKLKLVGKDSEVEIRLNDHIYSGVSEVLEVDEDVLFASVQTKPSK
ncbi:MAG: tRNA (N6-threonylcarbamoyladenosine(37)-N6)-methyltransferase TrmO [Methanosarcina sp.]|nr:tRNA (N6-threonylcarbamoyladenosine(37)-N6)-methyltransferase TrmO [Methanosarcina sp.]